MIFSTFLMTKLIWDDLWFSFYCCRELTVCRVEIEVSLLPTIRSVSIIILGLGEIIRLFYLVGN